MEQPGKGDDTRAWGPPFIEGESAYYLSINRNKRSITLNLKSDEGQEIIGKLIDEADVVVENFKPGATKRLGLDYESVRERKPDIVYTSISGGEVVKMLDQASVPRGPISTLPEVFGSDDIGAA